MSATQAGLSLPSTSMVTRVTRCTASAEILSRLVMVARARMRLPTRTGAGDRTRVQAVVDAHGDVVDLAQLAGQIRDERQREEPVGHRSAERPGRGALGVDVDPLVILGVVGEAVDPLLVDLEPLAGADLLTDRGFEVGHAVVSLHLISCCAGLVAPTGYVSVPQRIIQAARRARDSPGTVGNERSAAGRSGWRAVQLRPSAPAPEAGSVPGAEPGPGGRTALEVRIQRGLRRGPVPGRSRGPG